MNFKKIKVEDAVGTVLGHDITRIVPGEYKGVGFKKGHVVAADDIPALLKLGKQHLYVLDLSDDLMHEDDAAMRIATAVSGQNIEWTHPSEGKSSMKAACDGIVKIDAETLLRINSIDKIIVSTLKNNSTCKKGQVVAATRIIPLTIEKEKIGNLEALTAIPRKVVKVLPFRNVNVGAVVTGSEIYSGLIKDEFDRFVGTHVAEYGGRIIKKILAPDVPERIAEAVSELQTLGCDLILTTGGLSVDPDDVTPLGIRQAGAEIISYGAPVLPGAMFLYAILDSTPILGLPACVYYHTTTVFNLFLPRVLAGDPISRNEIAAMGHGGLCLNCEICRFPICPFGR
ncbi:MAG: molybdopterin-binding protein [Desulfobacteraceae bacterium]|nr:molybdopterin-binding protein [Desulfobacteraceae bacterium]